MYHSFLFVGTLLQYYTIELRTRALFFHTQLKSAHYKYIKVGQIKKFNTGAAKEVVYFKGTRIAIKKLFLSYLIKYKMYTLRTANK